MFRRLVVDSLESRVLLACDAGAFVVNVLDDVVDSDLTNCSLREAIDEATMSGLTTPVITFDPSIRGGTINLDLALGELVVGKQMIIDAGPIQSQRGDGITVSAALANDGASTPIRVISVDDGVDPGCGGLMPPNPCDSFVQKVEIRNMTITGGTKTGAIVPVGEGGGGGIRVFQGEQLVIRDSVISGNSASSEGGGLAAYDYSAPPATPVYIYNTSITDNMGGGVFFSGVGNATNLKIEDSLISGNESALGYDTGGVFVRGNGGTVNITRSTITGNSAADGGGARIIANSFRNDSGDVFNACINVDSSTFEGNTALFAGSGILVETDTIADQGSSVFGCPEPAAGMTYFADEPVVQLTNVTVSGNTNEQFGNGAVAVQDAGFTTRIRHSTIVDNSNNNPSGADGLFLQNNPS
ncbi:MAG: right-handed parallel beta-helix repeat-containing protein, partial [Planctomycetota bacterium]